MDNQMTQASDNYPHSPEKKVQIDTQISTCPLVRSVLLLSKVQREMKNQPGLQSDTSNDAS